MSSRIEQLIDEIEEYIDSCKYQTFSNSKILVNKDEIEELFGPSVPQMLGSEDVEKSLADEAMKSFEKDLDHSVMAILSGYMR